MAGSTSQFFTHGCRLNAYETHAMQTLAANRTDAGDLVVINTCAVTAQAVRKARQEVRKQRAAHPSARLVVTGCAAQTNPATFANMPEVDMVIGNHEKMLPETWTDAGRKIVGRQNKTRVGDIMSVKRTTSPLIDGFGSRARAYVQVQNGCDHRCTFCIIPFGRGNSRSVPATVVVEQIKRLVGRGYNEVVLSGVDLTSWGADLADAGRLGDLVGKILTQVPELPRLRISSIDSIEVDAALMDAIANQPRLMPHLHLSLQSGDNIILKRMKRRHNRDDAIRFCRKARELRPDMTFGADIIAGFPTETGAMFQNSLALVQECDLTWLHVFPYSARPGTPAARMPQTDGATIKRRAAQLRAMAQQCLSKYLAGQIGKQHRILMESPRLGRTEQFARVLLDRDATVASIVRARITGVNDGQLTAEISAEVP